jgi:cell division protein FtsW (lipid II flippase)
MAPESTMMAIVFGLVCFSVVMVYSATSAQAVLAGTSPYAFAEKQLLYALIGGAAFLFCRHWDPKFLQRVASIGLVASIFALMAVVLIVRPQGFFGRAGLMS